MEPEIIESLPTEQPVDNTFKKYIPYLTATCCVVSLVLFIGINTEGTLAWDDYKRWGSPSVFDIFDGSIWGLITSNFLHVEIWHIACNLYWFWLFGKKIEFETGKIYYVLLILSAALVSSLAELSFSDTSGIGLSGIVYAFFGFIIIKGKKSEEYKNFIHYQTINLFVIWLFLCLVLTKSKAMNIGNAAHFGGLLWGATLAYISRFKNIMQWSISMVFLIIIASMIFWSPFSTSYLTVKVTELHKNQKIDEAILVYQQILDRDPDNEFAKLNLKPLQIYQLEQKAWKLHTEQKYLEAREIYIEILRMDSSNSWAKLNLEKLPPE